MFVENLLNQTHRHAKPWSIAEIDLNWDLDLWWFSLTVSLQKPLKSVCTPKVDLLCTQGNSFKRGKELTKSNLLDWFPVLLMENGEWRCSGAKIMLLYNDFSLKKDSCLARRIINSSIKSSSFSYFGSRVERELTGGICHLTNFKHSGTISELCANV